MREFSISTTLGRRLALLATGFLATGLGSCVGPGPQDPTAVGKSASKAPAPAPTEGQSSQVKTGMRASPNGQGGSVMFLPGPSSTAARTPERRSPLAGPEPITSSEVEGMEAWFESIIDPFTLDELTQTASPKQRLDVSNPWFIREETRLCQNGFSVTMRSWGPVGENPNGVTFHAKDGSVTTLDAMSGELGMLVLEFEDPGTSRSFSAIRFDTVRWFGPGEEAGLKQLESVYRRTDTGWTRTVFAPLE